MSKYLGKSIASAKGHLDQQYKNCRYITTTTRDQKECGNTIEEEIITPITECTNLVFVAIKSSQHYSPRRKNPIDQTGRFTILSNKVNQYIMFMYEYDSNAILIHPMKNRTAAEITNAFPVLHKCLCRVVLKPQFDKLNNEPPEKLITKITDKNVEHQLVFPHSHRRDPAERAIRTFKNYFIAALCSTDPNFPMK